MTTCARMTVASTTMTTTSVGRKFRARSSVRRATWDVVVPGALRVEGGAAAGDVDPSWVEGMVTFWLDEEWERGAVINADIGRAAAESYAKCVESRARVEAETGEVDDEAFQQMVMTLASDLLAFDFNDSFVSAFEVANKVIEMLMLRQGVDVCCVSEEDLTREDRYLAWLDAGGSR